MFRLVFIFSFVLLIVSAVPAQDSIKPLAENASIADTQKWLAEALTKHASFKARASASTVSDVKFEGCDLRFRLVRRTGGISQDAVGVTTRVNTVKTDVAFDMAQIEQDGVEITDHLLPQFQILTIRYRTDTQAERLQELVVREEAAEHFKSAFTHARRICSSRS